MARSNPTKPQPAHLTAEQMAIGKRIIERRIADLRAFDPSAVSTRWAPDVKALEASIDDSLQQVFGSETTDYHRWSGAARLDNGPITLSMGGAWGGGRANSEDAQFQRYLTEGKERAVALLEGAAKGLAEKLADQTVSENGGLPVVDGEPQLTRTAFVVHGHDGQLRDSVGIFWSGKGLKS